MKMKADRSIVSFHITLRKCIYFHILKINRGAGFLTLSVYPSQTEFCCSSSTDEDLSSVQYINILCLMAFNIHYGYTL